ncbi:hypothetical protein HDU89_001926 [Geranomyces variabilis]|nr:hypothetical protein HDU89_001926 [Geranomyces variabilis]
MNDSEFVAAVKETTLSWAEFAADLLRQLDLLPSESNRNCTQQRLAKRLTKYLSRSAAFEAVRAEMIEGNEPNTTNEVHKEQVKITSNIAGDVFPAHKRSADASSSKVLKKAKRTKVAKENESALPSAQAAASSIAKKATPSKVKTTKTTTTTATTATATTTTTTTAATPSAHAAVTDDKHDDTTTPACEASDLAACRAMLLKMVPQPQGIYLLRVGRLKDLRRPMAIANSGKNNDVVFKFGRTIDLAQRFLDHIIDFEQLPNVKLTLEKVVLLEGVRASRVEVRLKEWILSRGWLMKACGPETLQDGGQRTPNRVEVILCQQSL